MLGICKSAKSHSPKAQTRYAQTVGPSGNNADSQTPSITKTPADVDKYNLYFGAGISNSFFV